MFVLGPALLVGVSDMQGRLQKFGGLGQKCGPRFRKNHIFE